MTYQTILTSKGTTTIPKEIRKQLGIKPGMYVSFQKNKETGDYTIKRSQTIEEIRDINKQAIQAAKTQLKDYRSGDGFIAHVQERYGEGK